MPNIEIYEDKLCESSLKPKIDKIVKDLGYKDKAITTVIECYPRSCNGKNEPRSFIRICSPHKGEIQIIVEAFKKYKLGVDTETLLLAGFIPTEEMK